MYKLTKLQPENMVIYSINAKRERAITHSRFVFIPAQQVRKSYNQHNLPNISQRVYRQFKESVISPRMI